MKIIEIKSTNNTDTMVFIDKITHITETKKGCDIFFGDYKLETTANFLDIKNAVYEQIARYEARKRDTTL
jgi:hypothetical protein